MLSLNIFPRNWVASTNVCSRKVLCCSYGSFGRIGIVVCTVKKKVGSRNVKSKFH